MKNEEIEDFYDFLSVNYFKSYIQENVYSPSDEKERFMREALRFELELEEKFDAIVSNKHFRW